MRRLLAAVAVAGALSAPVSAQDGRVQSPLPAPTGPYSVGRTQLDWTDESRPDDENPAKHREIVVWLWYPASPKPDAEPAEQLPGKWRELFWSDFKQRLLKPMGKDQVDDLPAIRTHSFADAPVAQRRKPYPILLFEPGLGMTPLVYSSLLEDVASHGYILAGIVPTYYTGLSIFSDGRVASSHLPKPPAPGEKRENRPDPQEQFFHFWTDDMRFTLNQLERLNQDSKSPFKGRFDCQRVGAFGQSFGGAASIQAAKDDVRVKAAMDIDGRLWGDVMNAGVSKPLLIFRSDLAEQIKISRAQPQFDEVQFRERFKKVEHDFDSVLESGNPGYSLTLTGSTHMFSSDLALMPVLQQSIKPVLGTIDAVRALSVTKTYVNAFFGQYLQGTKSSLMSRPSSKHPEIKFEVHSSTSGAR